MDNKEIKPENPPAFASSHGTDKYEREQVGMDLRDYFAAKTMNACVIKNTWVLSYEEVAEISYKMADAMLKARIL